MLRTRAVFTHATTTGRRVSDADTGEMGAMSRSRVGAREAVTDTRGASIVESVLSAHRRRRGGASTGGASGDGLLTETELQAIERDHPDGLTAVQVVEIFTARGVRFSEASFRKYVQQGLLPRSRRVGRKGKHRGSLGMYPPVTVRRVNEIKRLMAEGYTIEEIQTQFLRFTNLVEALSESVSELFSNLEGEVTSPRLDNRVRRNLSRELSEAREVADELLARLDGITRQVTAPRGDRYRGSGAAGSAEDLL